VRDHTTHGVGAKGENERKSSERVRQLPPGLSGVMGRGSMSFIVVLLSAFVLLDGLWLVLAWRGLKVKGWRWVAAGWMGAMLGGLLLFLGSRFGGVRVEELLPRPLVSAIFIWHLMILPLWLIWLVVRGFFAAGRRIVRGPAPVEDGVSRREFISTAARLAPAVLTTGAALGSEPQLEEFRIRRIEVPLEKLPPALDGLTIAHVSDVHVGRFTRGKILERIAETTNSLNADLTLMTGDLINHSLSDLPAGIELMRGLRAKHGVFLCEGNHDLFADAPGFRRDVRRAGLQLLREDAATVEIRGTPVQLFGLRWERGDAGHREALQDLEKLRRSDAFPLLLAHHPHVFDFAEEYPLILAGHTHGGQMMLNPEVGFGPWMFRYWSGLYRRGSRALVVSNGVGNWFPLRIEAPAEIAHITLRKGKA